MNTTLRITIVAVAVVTVLAVLGVSFAFAQGMSPWGGNGMTLAPVRSAGVGNYGYTNQNGTPAPYGIMNGQGTMGSQGGMAMMSNGDGMMSGQGMMSSADTVGTMHTWMSTTGGMHDLVWGALADALGLTEDDLNARLTDGETLAQIAEAQGVTQAEVSATLETTVRAGLAQAVTGGTLTQAQADQMLSHMAGKYGSMLTQMGAGMGFGPGNCHANAAVQSNS